MATSIVLFFSMILYSAHVYAELYVIDPPTPRICHGDQPCTISWLDDGKAPLLDIIRYCYVALYNNDEILIQQIGPVDVSTTRSLTFIPSHNAGPDSDRYYVSFTSIDLVDGKPYQEYSSFFTIDGMTGSFNSPIPSLTSFIPISSSLLTPPSTSTPPSSTPTPSGMTTSRISPSSSLSSPSSSPSVISDQSTALDILPRWSKLTITATSMLLFVLFELR